MDLKDRQKLEKLLNMLGSEFEGERANAGGMIKKMADRYNVTPADLCLNSPGGQPRASSFSNTFYQKATDAYAEQAARRDAETARREAFHRQREAELREAGRRAAEARAKPRVRKDFDGIYFGLLARLKAIYDNQFEITERWDLDFIERVLRTCRADREMTYKDMSHARRIIKKMEEPLI